MANRKPKMTESEVRDKVLRKHSSVVSESVYLVGIRGYYRDSYGRPGVNDRGYYDDAIFVVADDYFEGWQANTDPSIFRSGIATLVPGVYEVVKWKHRGRYNALQIVKDTVSRDGQKDLDTGRHGINFHYGGPHQTWSEGCQTLPKSSYDKFLKTVYALMDRRGLKSVKYVLLEG